ncbi:hypothetical protein KL928_001697 [Ogataea angusta]|uniref:Lysophospholipase n=1 Tax=Pichia angusta TaxID=870730 RepID=A0AAN6DGI4_PICAN|nr:uncharacterized protein KL928_001697 [Ogataea angusta]KAG7820260.1 hypothetical protein KL928_001697 [Ogataea angusta]
MYFDNLLIYACLCSLVLSAYTGFQPAAELNTTWNVTNETQATNSSLPALRHQIKCPSYPLLRSGDQISLEEKNYVMHRKQEAKKHVVDLFTRFSIDEISSAFFDNYTPSIAISLSGGSFRSFLTAAGVLEAFDSRTPGTTEYGCLGGLLQSTTYMAGVSGGSWLILSLMQYDFGPISELKSNGSWKLNSSSLRGLPELSINFKDSQRLLGDFPTDIPTITVKTSNSSSSFMVYFKSLFRLNQLKKSSNEMDSIWNEALQFYETLHEEVSRRKQHGYKTSLTDYWGKAIGDIIFSSSGPHDMTMSGARSLSSFKNHTLPFPIILTNSKNVDKSNEGHRRIFEFNPFEFGSWEEHLKAFVKLDYLGTKMLNGKPLTGLCTIGYDEMTFIAGTSSSLFNSILSHLWKYMAKSKKQTYDSMKTILNVFGLTSCEDINANKYVSDYALIYPNPFYGYGNTTLSSTIRNSTDLYLVDGGEDENIPFQPFHQRTRSVDVIIAIDSSSDLDNFPNGTNIGFTSNQYQSSKSFFVYDEKRYAVFPNIPSPDLFVENKLNKRPVFFGCHIKSAYKYLGEASKYSNETSESWLPPLIVYIPNTGYTTNSNKSTFKLSYEQNEMAMMIENGYSVGTYGNNSYDQSYFQCIGCAIIKRELDTTGRDIPDTCQKCFKNFCYN